MKELIILTSILIASRLIGLDPNVTPLLALAVFAPRMNLSPWLALGVLAITDVVLGFYSIMPIVYACMFGAYYISKNLSNVYVAGATSVLLWHIVVNGAVVMFGAGFAPFTPEALLFDMRLLGSTLAFTALIDITQRLTQQLRQSQV
jgi:hypothetical protein|tara:strand:+ start:880 stop:1320 length:441 start_codon:yes stop_codon:yes gene_type:complete